MKPLKPASLVLTALLAIGIVSVRAQSTAFTYQGRLRDNTIPAVGVFDLRFALYGAATGGTPVGSSVTAEDVAVTNGLFCVVLDFGVNAFTGAERWLETALRPGAETGSYTVLAPRRALTAAPYALYAPNAGTAGTATSMAAANLTGTLSDARLSANVAFLNANQVFSGSNMFAGASLFSGAARMTNTGNLVGGTHAGDGASLSNLTAAFLTGTAPIATNFSGWLVGDVTGPQSNTVVAKVGGVSAANMASAAYLANAAVSANNANTIVKRDGGGGFAAGTITGTLFNGSGSGLTSLNADQIATGTVADARLSSSATSGLNAANTATAANTANTIVKRDGTGSFAAERVTGSFVGDGSGLTNISAANIIGGGQASLPSGMTVVSAVANDPVLVASGYRMIMTVPPPAWVTSSADGAPSGRFGHTTIWDGQRFIIWGGRLVLGSSYLNSGGMYYPDSDQWQGVSTIDAASPRWGHTAVWNGSEMLIWGGNGATGRLNTGGRFQPDTKHWKKISMIGAPAARTEHVAVWTGSRMLIWGGQCASGLTNEGSLYAPVADQWAAVTAVGAPTARVGATAVWATDRVLIWGGEGAGGVLNSGAQFLNSAWMAMTSASAPAARRGHSAIWTGTKMIVWGGHNDGVPLGCGAAYDPALGTWTALPSTGAPSARFNHAAVWTGQEMLIVGGSNGTTEFASGAAYDPSTGAWRTLSSSGSPRARTEAAASWTGTEVLIFGGRAQGLAIGLLQRLVPQPGWYFYRKL